MRLSLLVAFLFTSTVALAADRQINQISVEQSDSQTIIRLFGSDLIRSPKDRVFFAAEASSYSVEPTMMYGDSEYVEVALGMPVMAGQYRISIGPNENTSTLESMVVIGAIGPQGPAGRDGADGRDGVDGLDGAPGADGQDGMDGADGLDGAKGDPGVDGADGSSCSVTQTTSGATLSCTDGTMASVANGLNGANGRDGVDGANGRDGSDGTDGVGCSIYDDLNGELSITCGNGAPVTLTSFFKSIFGQQCVSGNFVYGISETGALLCASSGGGLGGGLVADEIMPGVADDYFAPGGAYEEYRFAVAAYPRQFPIILPDVEYVDRGAGFQNANHTLSSVSSSIEVFWDNRFPDWENEFEERVVEVLNSVTDSLTVVDELRNEVLLYILNKDPNNPSPGLPVNIRMIPDRGLSITDLALMEGDEILLEIYPMIDGGRLADFSGLNTVLTENSQIGAIPSDEIFYIPGDPGPRLFCAEGSNRLCLGNTDMPVGGYDLTMTFVDGKGGKQVHPFRVEIKDEQRVNGELHWSIIPIADPYYGVDLDEEPFCTPETSGEPECSGVEEPQ